MPLHPADDRLGDSPEVTRVEILGHGRPLPPPEESAIEDLTDAEWQAFWDVITSL